MCRCHWFPRTCNIIFFCKLLAGQKPERYQTDLSALSCKSIEKVMWPSVFWIQRSWGWCGEAVVLNFCHCIVIHWGSLVKIHHRSDITVMLNIHRQTPLLWHFHFCVSKYSERKRWMPIAEIRSTLNFACFIVEQKYLRDSLVQMVKM